jgi:glycosyltransferase involved in cell wall biosynthesis
MRIEVLTSLYPTPLRPSEGIFAERRWQAMRARGHSVRVVQPLPWAPRALVGGAWREIACAPRRELRAGIEVERPRYLHLPGRARANARRFAQRASEVLAARERPDVVVADYAWPAAAIAPHLCERGVPCVVSGRGSDVTLVAGEAELAPELAFCLRAAGNWCAVSADLVRAMDRLAGAEGRGALVPNGVDLELFRPAERASARAELGLPPPDERGRPRLVLVVGHWIERKDPLLALEVFARGAAEDDRLVFLGRGPLGRSLEQAIAARGLAARAELRGEVAPAALARWYAASDLLLLTSRREGRPNVVLEALACGRPVLATDAGGTAELLGAHERRMLARTRDPGELGAQLAELLAAPPAAAELRALVAGLSWTASCAALERCLERAVADER